MVVYVHGSDNTPSVDRVWEPYLLAAHGVAMLVFDKRGTGRSGGTYTQMFSTLSDDVVAAIQWLRTQPNVDTTRIGLAGFSQGGWVAPLAARKDPSIKFVLVAYGMTMSIAEEDQLEAPLKLRARGFADRDVAEFQELNAAIHQAATRRFAEGWSDAESAATKYRDRPWMKAVPELQSWASMLLGMGLDQAKVASTQRETHPDEGLSAHGPRDHPIHHAERPTHTDALRTGLRQHDGSVDRDANAALRSCCRDTLRRSRRAIMAVCPFVVGSAERRGSAPQSLEPTRTRPMKR